MTIIGFSDLPPNEHEPYNLANHFLSGRLEEWATADWALALNPWQNAERAALQDTYLHRASHPLTEPWPTFWGWLLESWTTALPAQHDRVSPYQIGELIRRGDRSGRTINAIVDVVRPYVVISERVSFHGPARKRPKTPRDVGDLAFIRLGSGALPDEGVLGLEKVTEPLFLAELAHALECALMHGLDVARRLPWTGEDGLWRIGELHRVYPAYYMEDPGHRPREPDEHNEGVAPSAKLLFVTVSRLSTLDPAAAQVFLERWRSEDSLVFIRLWAAAARDRALIEADEVAAFLRACDAHRFWDLHLYPEIAEMRARRFADLANKAQMAIVARLKRLPPRAHWPRLPRDKLEEVRLFWAAREFKRIEIAGGALPAAAAAWLVSHTTRFPDIEAMRAIDEGFPQAVEVHGSDTTPDLEYDALSGIARLRAMEHAAAAPGSWSNGPSERARYWLGLPGRFLNLIKDLEATPGGGAAFPNVWDMLGRLHRPDSAITTSDPSAPPEISVRVLTLIAQLPEKTMREAVVGLTDWLSAWEKQVIERPELPAIWARLWPFAVAATNAHQDECREIHFIQLREGERQDIDTLNNPAGKMIDVFFEACPNLRGVPHPFADNSHLRAMRDAIVAAPGRAGLVAKCRLLEKLAYFLNADAQWTRAQVIPAILEDSAHDAPILWRALAWRTQFGDVIGEIGEAMADRAADLRYARETRKALAFSLVVHMLNAYWEERAHAAESLRNFVASVARTEEEDADKRQGAAAVFRKAAAPVLTDVWPQERSLSTPGVARALADLPAASGGAFADAVRIIERFLVQFDAWSMSAYGLYGSGDDGLKLNRIDEEKKADAFLTLLDLTIGPQEGATIPSDLGQALQRIGEVAPTLARDRRFRRLAALSRRWS